MQLEKKFNFQNLRLYLQRGVSNRAYDDLWKKYSSFIQIGKMYPLKNNVKRIKVE
jgi:hypothetical protein